MFSCPQLLDGVLGLLDALLVFHDGPQEEWTEMAKLSFGRVSVTGQPHARHRLCSRAAMPSLG